jgi:2-dehydro-3-deoxygluconokinase
VAVQFCALGGEASLVSRLPENRLAEALLEKLRAWDIEARSVLRGGGRPGLYFLEPGFGLRASVIIYDRAACARARRAVCLCGGSGRRSRVGGKDHLRLELPFCSLG